MKRYIKCKSPELYGRFIARGYYGTNYSGLADSFESSDYEYIKDKVHDMLSAGDYVEVEDTLTGASYRIDPDTYFEDFDGEFNVTREMQDFQDQTINASRKISKSKIVATEYVDVHNLADDSQFSVKPSEVYDLLNNYTGDVRNLETGWVGTVMQLRPELSYQPYAIVFGLEYDDNTRDYIYLYPQDSDRRSCIMYMGQYGMPKFANSIRELRGILNREFLEFERVRWFEISTNFCKFTIDIYYNL